MQVLTESQEPRANQDHPVFQESQENEVSQVFQEHQDHKDKREQ